MPTNKNRTDKRATNDTPVKTEVLMHESDCCECGDEQPGVRFIHCMKCLRQRPAGQSPAEWARLNVSLSAKGLEVWCVRHAIKIDAYEFKELR